MSNQQSSNTDNEVAISVDGTETNTEATDGNSPTEENSSLIKESRRGILITMCAGAMGLSATSTPAAAQTGGDKGSLVIDNISDEALDGNPEAIPDKLAISPNSQFKIKTPNWVQNGQFIIAEIKVKRLFSDDSGHYESIGKRAFRESGKTEYVIQGDDYPDEGRNLFNHDDLEPEDFEVDKDLSKLENEDERYTAIDFMIELSAKTRNGTEVIDPVEQEFTVKYALSGGLGVNLGYNLGQKAPTPEFVGEIDD